FRQAVPPPGDDFDHATQIRSLPFSDSVSTLGATLEPFENPPACYTSASGTVWYGFTAPRDLVVKFDTQGSNDDPSLVVYTARGDVTPGVEDRLRCDATGGVAEVRLSMHAGDSVWVQVRDTGGSVTFNASLEREGLLPRVEIVALSPIAVEHELL